jgi:GT2 family glycosyltransferase
MTQPLPHPKPFTNRSPVGTVENEPAVSIIILSWNSKALIQTCLTSLKQKTDYSNYKVIVVDNGSVDGSVVWLKQNFPWVDVIALDKNYGFSISNNRGTAYALRKYNPQFVLLLNNDTQITQENWLKKMVSVAQLEDSIGIVGCKLIYRNGETQYIGTKLTSKGLSWLKPTDYPILPQIYATDGVLGACFLIKRSVIEKIGGLDIGFSPFGHEESDFCIRAKKVGFNIYMVSSVAVVHENRASINKVKPGYARTVGKANSMRFMLLNFPLSWLVKRLPYEGFLSSFIGRNVGGGAWFVKPRARKEMLIELKTNFEAWKCNLKNFKEILVKRQNRNMRLPL